VCSKTHDFLHLPEKHSKPRVNASLQKLYQGPTQLSASHTPVIRSLSEAKYRIHSYILNRHLSVMNHSGQVLCTQSTQSQAIQAILNAPDAAFLSNVHIVSMNMPRDIFRLPARSIRHPGTKWRSIQLAPNLWHLPTSRHTELDRERIRNLLLIEMPDHDVRARPDNVSELILRGRIC
jgi:hypothetical protein